ncbi:hypothetical protein [Absidia glauca]|uniref:Uncharacterized protein n=1 Tax=Absidia glauca TaxID=4829 RepID=A0A168N7G0_ABSGL|nr:hypothetical protein [Absidia glauca]
MGDVKLWWSRHCRHRVRRYRRHRRSLSIVKKKRKDAKRRMLVMVGKSRYLVVRRRKISIAKGCVRLRKMCRLRGEI